MFLQSLLEQLPQDDPDYIYNMGCLLYQDGKYEEACKKFTSAMQVLGYVPGTCPSASFLPCGSRGCDEPDDLCVFRQRCPTTSPCVTTA